MKIMVTGGAGFIGSALVRFLIDTTDHKVLNIDKLTYAGNLLSLAPISKNPRYKFVQADICDAATMREIIQDFSPDKIIHLAAESHVDRSVDGPSDFIKTNILGTFTLLQAVLAYWQSNHNKSFIFHHVSTDEVYGSLGNEGHFTELTAYSPNSPYSASKASSDHLVRAWHATYGLPTIISNCSNNYGSYQFPEKMIPLMILNALNNRLLPIFGEGKNVRDWLHVEDHVRALYLIMTRGKPGETYNIGGNNEWANIDVVNLLCSIVDTRFAESEELAARFPDSPCASAEPANSLITYVEDRPGHDTRYAIDADKIMSELGYKPAENFETGLKKTVDWYLSNELWWQSILDGSYKK